MHMCGKTWQFDIPNQVVRQMTGVAGPIFTDEKGDVHYIGPDLVQVTSKWVEDKSLKSGIFQSRMFTRSSTSPQHPISMPVTPSFRNGIPHTPLQSLAERGTKPRTLPRMDWRFSSNPYLEGPAWLSNTFQSQKPGLSDRTGLRDDIGVSLPGKGRVNLNFWGPYRLAINFWLFNFPGLQDPHLKIMGAINHRNIIQIRQYTLFSLSRYTNSRDYNHSFV